VNHKHKHELNEVTRAIADRAIEIRKALNLSQSEFSKKIKVSKAYVNTVERGCALYSVHILMRICNTFNVSADWLLFGNVDKNYINFLKGINYLSQMDKKILTIKNNLLSETHRVELELTVIKEIMKMEESEEVKTEIIKMLLA